MAVVITSEAHWGCLVGEIPYDVFLAIFYGFSLALFYKGQRSIQTHSRKRRMIVRII